MCSPTTKEDEQVIRDATDDDAALIDVADVFEAKENISIAEGMLIDIFEQLADRRPKWNKIGGSKHGRTKKSFFSHDDKLRLVKGLSAGMSIEEVEKQIEGEGPPYELLLNLEGSELSQLNARATLREIASDPTICEHELVLHGVRMGIVSQRINFEQSLKRHLVINQYAQARIDLMIADGYWNRTLKIPGF